MIREVDASRAAHLLRQATHLVQMWRNTSVETAELAEDHEMLEADARMMRELQDGMRFHTLPVAGLGSGRGTVKDKFVAVMHAFFLEASSSMHGLAAYCKSVVTTTTDYGVEFSLNTVKPVRLRKIFPWLLEMGAPSPPMPAQGCYDEADDMPDPPPAFAAYHPDGPEVALDEALAMPGLLHILHNAGNSILSVVAELDGAVDKLAEVCKLIRNPDTGARLREHCFGGPVGRTFHEDLKKFRGRVYRARWGSVAFAVFELLMLQEALRHFWNLERYLGGAQPARDDDGGAKIYMVDEAIQDPYLWALLQTLDAMFEIIRQLESIGVQR